METWHRPNYGVQGSTGHRGMVEATSATCLLFIWVAEPFTVRARGDEPLAILNRIAAAQAFSARAAQLGTSRSPHEGFGKYRAL